MESYLPWIATALVGLIAAGATLRERRKGENGTGEVQVLKAIEALAESVASRTDAAEPDAGLRERLASLERAMAQLEEDVLKHLRKAARERQAARRAAGLDDPDEDDQGEDEAQQAFAFNGQHAQTQGSASLEDVRALMRQRAG